ncbi:MAG: pilus assembly FimT family protein, partial [Vulcanimicrobiaceae bacterium]
MERQRGFSLLETLVTVAILAILLAGTLVLRSIRPFSLGAATAGYDAAVAAAVPLAEAGSNGATLVFLPRLAGTRRLPGFLLRVYSGRPSASGAVQPTTMQTVVAEADISATGLQGSSSAQPPFAIFLNARAHASGLAGYPSATSSSANSAPVPQFPALAHEPSCPPGGITLTFTSPTGRATRHLPCSVSLAGPAGRTPEPGPAFGSNPLWLTRKALIFAYPRAPRQHFVATEFGYRRWYAADGFSCFDSGGMQAVATLPQSDPAPPYWGSEYAPASPPPGASPAPEMTAQPAPSGVPYAFPWSPTSMDDAPAWFWVDPSAPGLCTLTIADANGQQAGEPIDVMGPLTVSGPGVMMAPSASATVAFPSASAPGTSVVFAKTYDPGPLSVLAGGAGCGPIVSIANSGPGAALPTPGPMPATSTWRIAPLAAGTCVAEARAAGQTGQDGLPLGSTDAEPPLPITIAVGSNLAWEADTPGTPDFGPLTTLSSLVLESGQSVTISPLKTSWPQETPVTLAASGPGCIGLSGLPNAMTLIPHAGLTDAPVRIGSTAVAYGRCTIVATAAYAGGFSERATLVIDHSATRMQTWPVAELSAVSGATLALASPVTPMAWVNHLLGGGTAQAGTPGCHVVVFKTATDLSSPSSSMGDIDANDPGHSGYATDANGCLTYS